MTPSTRAEQIATRVRQGTIPHGDWTTRIRDDIWTGPPPHCHSCHHNSRCTPLHIVRGHTRRAIATLCPNCDRAA